MQSMKVGARLAMLAAVMLVLLASVGGVALYGMHQTDVALKSMYEDRTVALGQLGEARDRMLRNLQHLTAAVADPAAPAVPARLTEVEANAAAITKVWAAYSATYLTDAEKVLATTYAAARGRFVSEAIKPALAALRAGDAASARRIVLELAPGLSGQADKTMGELVALQVNEAEKLYVEGQARYQAMLWLSSALLAIGLVAGAGLAWAVSRSVTRQLGGEPSEVVRLANAVAEGDLGHAIHVAPGDESSIVAAMARMQSGLSGIVGRVRASSDSIATGATQIAAGNTDLSQRTEQQASNLQQTASSMEELSSTVRHNADTAQQANQLAASASGAAAKGGEVVGQVVSTMQDISASSKKIADIIGVIDGIAFQTNILALNAAVEAARAGEQGRGFAVVAGEVRSLAQRSAEAAREIKALIGASVDKVEAGTRLVGAAGQAMTDIVAQVNRVTDLIGEISSATAEQTSGIDQVSTAVSQLDQVTQQNAALVEESAAAAESLRHQGNALAEVVGFFRLGSGASSFGASAPSRAVSAPSAARPAAASPAAAAPRPVKPASAQNKPSADADWETF